MSESPLRRDGLVVVKVCVEAEELGHGYADGGEGEGCA